MLILGDLSGIQNYLFNIAEAGGGQARRLRARSFFLQLLTECAALRVLRALDWATGDQHFLMSGAGKFVLSGPSAANGDAILAAERQRLNDWLLEETRGELRFFLAWADTNGSAVENYRLAQRRLQVEKARPWGPVEGTSWRPERLVLAPLDTPCGLCRHAPAVEEEADSDSGLVRRVCRTCADNRNLGRRLPNARWLVIRDQATGTELSLFGLGVFVAAENRLRVGPGTLVVANYQQPANRPAWCPPEQFLHRRFLAHIPTEAGQPIEFRELAKRSRGDHVLGVLKADVDSLGILIDGLLIGQQNLQRLTDLSRELDDFFAGTLKEEIEARWKLIYTVFSGGDDLVMVGPWDVMMKFAGRLRAMFHQHFQARGLTISAGLALFKPMRPIKAAVAEADRLLEQVKTSAAPRESTPKDQVAAFGQWWKWEHHEAIVEAAERLLGWVEARQMERGWLHTLLELAEERHGPRPNPLATSRLAYHVHRNYRRGTEARHWADGLVRRFDDAGQVEVRYLPTIIRYALTATRSPGSEE